MFGCKLEDTCITAYSSSYSISYGYPEYTSDGAIVDFSRVLRGCFADVNGVYYRKNESWSGNAIHIQNVPTEIAISVIKRVALDYVNNSKPLELGSKTLSCNITVGDSGCIPDSHISPGGWLCPDKGGITPKRKLAKYLFMISHHPVNVYISRSKETLLVKTEDLVDTLVDPNRKRVLPQMLCMSTK